MKNISTTLAHKMAKVSLLAAVKARGAASHFGCHQPKEPKALSNLKQS